MIKKLFLAMTVYLSLVPKVAWAACSASEQQTDFGCVSKNDPVAFVSGVYGIGLSLIGGVGVLFVMFGGYLILTSQGDPEKLSQGKKYIYYAIAGILLALSGLAVYQIIGGDVLKIPGFK